MVTIINKAQKYSLIFSTNLFIFAKKFANKTRLAKKIKSSVLILPPTDYGSLGDQAMVSAVVDLCKRSGAEKINLICYSSVSECQNFYSDTEAIKYQNSFQFVRLVSRYEKFYCLGADVMDGFYSEKRSLLRAKLTALAAEVGVESCILGFSFNENPKIACVNALQKLPSNVELCIRDPISYERINKYIKRHTKLVADLAFLLIPNNDSHVISKVSKFVSKQHAQNRIVIGINANCKLLDSLDIKTPENLVKVYLNALTELSKNRQLSFLLIAHDFREKEGVLSDIAFSQMIVDSLPSQIKSHCMEVPIPCTASDIKAICGKIDMVLTGRMHLAIAALGQATPTACITYQGKFEGLFKHFELDGMTISPKQAVKSNNLSNFVIPLIENRNRIKQQISLKLPYIEQLAETNFDR